MEKLDFGKIIDGETFPIGGFCGVGVDENHDKINDYYLSLLKESGINFIVSGIDYNEENGKRSVEAYGKYGIGHFIQHKSISEITGDEPQEYVDKVVKDAVSEFRGEKCYIGPYFMDEPNRKGFKRLEKLYKAFKSLGVNGYPYVNLLPMIIEGPIDSDPNYTYEKYVEDFIKLTNPSFLSFDCYLFGTGLNNKMQINGNSMFQTFNVISYMSKKYNIPFWSFVACGGQWGSPIDAEDNYPNKAQFDIAVHISLAFGAKGIEYFPFLQPKMFYDTAKHEYVNGMVGYNGTINKWYYYAKEINEYIKRNESLFLNSDHDGVMFIGGSQSYPAYGGVVVNGNKYKEIDYAESNHALIGIFTYGTMRVLYIVNNSFTETAYVGLRFDRNYNFTIKEMSFDRCPSEKELCKDKCLMINEIPCGEAIIVEYDLGE